MVDILFVRHGETAWNVEKRMQGHLDIDLNAVGLQQAAALGRALQNAALDAVYSSDLKRALHTAQAITSIRELAIEVDAGLRERCFGAFEGRLYAELEASYPVAHAALKERNLDARYPAGEQIAETLREFSARALACVARLAAQPGQRQIAIVTHGGVLECIYRAATGTSLQQVRDFAIPNAGISRVQWNAGMFHIVDWANVSHLDISDFDHPALDETAP